MGSWLSICIYFLNLFCFFYRIAPLIRVFGQQICLLLLAGPSQALHNQSLSSSAVISSSLTTGKDGFQALETNSSSQRQDINQGRHHVSIDKNSKKTHSTDDVTHSLDYVTHLYNETHSSDTSTNILTSTLTSRGNLAPANGSSSFKKQKAQKGGASIAKSEYKLLSNELGLSRRHPNDRNGLRDTTKTYVKSRRKKRRKYYSPIHIGHHRRSHYHHRHRKANLQRRKSSVAVDKKLKKKEFTKSRRSLRHFQDNNRFPLFRGGERVLLRFKRKSLLEDDDKTPAKSRKKRKRKKRRETLRGHAKTRSLPPVNTVTFAQNGLTNGNYPRNMVWKRPGLTRNTLDRAFVAGNNAIPQGKYDPLIYGGRPSSLSLKPNEYKAFSNWRVSVSNVNKPPSVPVLPVNIGLKSNKPAQALPYRSETAKPGIAPAWNARFQNAEAIKQGNIQQPMKLQFSNNLPQVSRLIKGNDQSKKQFIPAAQRVFYGYEQQYPPQVAFAGGNPQKNAYPQTGHNNPMFFSQQRTRINPQWPSVLPAVTANSRMSVDSDALRWSRVSQGLVMSLNFEDVQSGRATYASLKGDVTDTDKRTEITRSFGLCGKVAKLNKGSEILLDGGQLKVMYMTHCFRWRSVQILLQT